MEIIAAADALRVPAAVDLAAIVIGALTGGLLAAREGFAVSGVLLLAVSGGLGGGLIRDVLLGDLPAVALTNKAYLPTVAITAAVTFYFSGWLSRLTGLLVVLDAVTLGFFTVIGAQKASWPDCRARRSSSSALDRRRRRRHPRRPAGATGRHRAARPYNAVAALIGATALTVLSGPVGLDPLPVAAAVIVLVAALRVLSVWRGWSAPVAVDLPGRTRDRLGAAGAGRSSGVGAGGVTSGAGSMLRGTIWRPALRARLVLRVQPDREHRDIVLGIGQEESLEHLVAEVLERQGGTLAEHFDQLGDTRVEVRSRRSTRPSVYSSNVAPASRTATCSRRSVSGATPRSNSDSVSSSRATLPSADITRGGGCPALDQRNTTRPALQVVLVLLEAGHERRGHRVQARPSMARSSSVSTSAGDPPLEYPMPRSRPRT